MEEEERQSSRNSCDKDDIAENNEKKNSCQTETGSETKQDSETETGSEQEIETETVPASHPVPQVGDVSAIAKERISRR